jgi:hypothetical protein
MLLVNILSFLVGTHFHFELYFLLTWRLMTLQFKHLRYFLFTIGTNEPELYNCLIRVKHKYYGRHVHLVDII